MAGAPESPPVPPVGLDDFERARPRNARYADKTMFVYEIARIRARASRPGPGVSGKTLLLSAAPCPPGPPRTIRGGFSRSGTAGTPGTGRPARATPFRS